MMILYWLGTLLWMLLPIGVGGYALYAIWQDRQLATQQRERHDADIARMKSLAEEIFKQEKNDAK